MTGWPLWLQLVMLLVGPMLAVVAHELTHYVTIWPVAETVDLEAQLGRIVSLNVRYEVFNDPWRLWYATLSDMAPAIFGLVGLAWLFFSGFTWTLDYGWIAWSWLWYMAGGANDYVNLLN